MKMTLGFHLTPFKMAKIKTEVTADAGKDVEKGTLLHCWCDCKLVQSLWKIICQSFRKLEIAVPEDPATSL